MEGLNVSGGYLVVGLWFVTVFFLDVLSTFYLSRERKFRFCREKKMISGSVKDSDFP